MNIKAIKTDYSGVTFKSKTEAIFARMLDQMGYKWEYEMSYETIAKKFECGVSTVRDIVKGRTRTEA